jgi:hypothetical protein
MRMGRYEHGLFGVGAILYAGPVDSPESMLLRLSDSDITIRGKNGNARIVNISYQTARTLDRYLHSWAGHAQPGDRSCGWTQ